MSQPASNLPSAFEKALGEFKTTANLSAGELNTFQLTTLDDLRRQISDIQNDQRKSKKLRYIKRLGPFLDTMEQYGKIVEVFLNVSDVVAFIWGPMKFLLMTARNYADAFNSLLDMYLDIGESMPHFAQYQTTFHDNAHMQLALVNIYKDILEFHKEALRYFRTAKWKELFQATWRSFSGTVAQLSHNLRRHKSLIESQMSIVEYELLQDLHTRSMRQFEEQKQAELDRKRLSVLQWLNPLDVQARHEDAAKARHGNSGEWLRQESIFQKWYDFQSCWEPLLWLTGIPGAGKTVLASRVIDLCTALPDARVTFFYCRHTDSDRSAFASVARTLVSQLLVGSEALIRQVYDIAAKSGEAMLSSENIAKEILAIALQACSPSQKTYIIIDGLDEYARQDRKEITAWLKEQVRNIPKTNLGKLRCLFISQDDGIARKDLSDCTSLVLTVKNTQADIESYCDMWHQLIDQRFGPLDLKEHNVAKLVVARAQGMFLYAKLVMWNLHEQPTVQDFLREMHPDVLPSGLEQAYGRILQRITGATVHPKRCKTTKKLLGWLTCAKRALYWHEIQCAMSVDLDEGSLCPEWRLKDDCKDLCASLVKLGSDGSVVLVHSTAKQFLIDKGHVSVHETQFDLAMLCLSYLSFDLFVYPVSEAQTHTSLHNGEYAFSDYATCFWALHLIEALHTVSDVPSGKLEDLVESIGGLLDAQWASPQKILVVSPTMRKVFSVLAMHDLYDKLCQAVVSAKNQLLPTGKGPSDDEPLKISKAVREFRKELEKLALSTDITPAQKEQLRSFYGSNLFKCHRPNCQFYSQGFATPTLRDHHGSRHERAFMCTEEGCPQAVIGCVTAQDLQKHMNEYHGTAMDLAAEFPEEEPEDVGGTLRTQKHPSRYQCNLCLKRFTRGYNLRTHQRTHTDEKPYVCSICGKAFARDPDRKRHERLHSGEKKFVCSGNLKNGNTWGCGSRFHRAADGLGKHFRSEAGRVCIRPLLEEEAQEMQDLNQSAQGVVIHSSANQLDMECPASSPAPLAQNEAPPFLPAALLAQYPSLAGIKWDQLPPRSPNELEDLTDTDAASFG